MYENDPQKEYQPDWVGGKRIDEVKLAKEYKEAAGLVYADGAFFTVDGRVTNEEGMRKVIYNAIKEYVRSGTTRRVESIMAALRMEAHQDNFDNDPFVIHFKNGTYDLKYYFQDYKYPCRYRLPVNFNPNAKKPVKWLKFLDELLEPTDILTLQEYMGYCLIPTNKAQKMMIITGNGGEGKSRLGLVMRSILGDNMSTNSIQSVERNRFTRATLEYKLLMVDDDMKLQALPETSYIKTMVTLEGKMDLEWKGKQSEQRMMYCRFLCFGNGPLLALYDRTHGFHRRQSQIGRASCRERV